MCQTKVSFPFFASVVILTSSHDNLMILPLDHPGKCWDGENEYSVGEHYLKSKCKLLKCKEDFSGTISE